TRNDFDGPPGANQSRHRRWRERINALRRRLGTRSCKEARLRLVDVVQPGAGTGESGNDVRGQGCADRSVLDGNGRRSALCRPAVPAGRRDAAVDQLGEPDDGRIHRWCGGHDHRRDSSQLRKEEDGSWLAETGSNYRLRQEGCGVREEESEMNERENTRDAENGRDPATIERDIDRTRASLGRTVDALERRLSPGELLDQALGIA